MQNHQKFQNLCAESSKVCEQNHQDNFFYKRSMQKCRQHDKMAAYCNFRQFRVVEDDLKLFCDIYIMLCHVSDANLGVGADCFCPKRAVDSSYSWNVHCFQIRWRICHSVAIDIKGRSCNRVNAAMNPVSIIASSRWWQKG